MTITIDNLLDGCR